MWVRAVVETMDGEPSAGEEAPMERHIGMDVQEVEGRRETATREIS